MYSPKIDKFALQTSFLLLGDEAEEEMVYVTCSVGDSSSGLMGKHVGSQIMGLEQFFGLGGGESLRVVLDASSLFRSRFSADGFNLALRVERFIDELCRQRLVKCLCTYDLSLLSPKMIKELTRKHSRLLLTTSDLTVLSGESFDVDGLSAGSSEETLKNNLESIVLALLQRKPMCGMEIIQTVHRDFNVLLSPGAVYPLLHALKDKGLVRFDIIGKTKQYLPAKDAEEEIQSILEEQIQANKFLSWYLKHITIPESGGENSGSENVSINQG